MTGIGPAITDRVPSPEADEPQIAQMAQIARANIPVIPAQMVIGA